MTDEGELLAAAAAVTAAATFVPTNEDGIRLSEISSLTDGQEKLLSLLYFTSGLLSVVGSSMIIYLVATNTRKTPYKRIMMGLSACDIIASATYAMSPFLLPKETSFRVWANGTRGTCSFLGVLTQFSFAAIWYNGALSFYYLCTVRFGVKTTAFARYYEPVVHILCIGYNVVTAIVGWRIDLFSESELGMACWIAEYPQGCEVTDSCTGNSIGWMFGGLPVILIFLAIVINNIVIFCFVKRTISRGAATSLRGNQHQSRRINAVATQAMLYVVSFMVAYIWAFAVRVLESFGWDASEESRIFPLLLLQSILLPLQGVFNLLIYTRPNYVRVRQEHKERSRLWALQKTWFGGSTSTRLTSVDASINGTTNSTRSGIVGTSKMIRAAMSRGTNSGISLIESTATHDGANGGGGGGGGGDRDKALDATAMRLRVAAEFTSTFSSHSNPSNRSLVNQNKDLPSLLFGGGARSHSEHLAHIYAMQQQQQQLLPSSSVIKEEESGELSSSHLDQTTFAAAAPAADADDTTSKKAPPGIIRKNVRLNSQPTDMEYHSDMEEEEDDLNFDDSIDRTKEQGRTFASNSVVPRQLSTQEEDEDDGFSE
jgi:hypothetical protein